MDNNIIGLWEKLDLSSVNDKEKVIKEFYSEFLLMEFWVEGKDYDGRLGFLLNETSKENINPLLFAYTSDSAEEPPEMLANAIREEGREFYKVDGISLLGILHALGCSLIVVSSGQKQVYIKREIINLFYNDLVSDENSGTSIRGRMSKKWFWIGVAVIVLLCFFGAKLYLDSYSQVSTAHLSDISWRIVKIDVTKGNFSVELPFNYETDSWKKDLAYELQSGNVFRVYKSNDAVFRNHIINIGFIPSGTSLSESMTDLDAQTNLMLYAMQKKLGEIKTSSKEHVEINNKDMVMVKGNMKINGDDARLTSVVALTGTGMMWIQVISAKGDSEEHDFFANKIINTVEIIK